MRFLIVLVLATIALADRPFNFQRDENGITTSWNTGKGRLSGKIPVQVQGSNTITGFDLSNLPSIPTSVDDLKNMLAQMDYKLPDGYQLNMPGLQMPKPDQLQNQVEVEENNITPRPIPWNWSQSNNGRPRPGQNGNSGNLIGQGALQQNQLGNVLLNFLSMLPTKWVLSSIGGDSKTPESLAHVYNGLSELNSKVVATMKGKGMTDEEIRDAFTNLAKDLVKVYTADVSDLSGKSRILTIEFLVNQFVSNYELGEAKEDLGKLVRQTAYSLTAQYPQLHRVEQNLESMINDTGLIGSFDVIKGESSLAYNQAYDIIYGAWKLLGKLGGYWLNLIGMSDFAFQLENLQMPSFGSLNFGGLDAIKYAVSRLVGLAMSMGAGGISLQLAQGALKHALEMGLGGPVGFLALSALSSGLGGGLGGGLGSGLVGGLSSLEELTSLGGNIAASLGRLGGSKGGIDAILGGLGGSTAGSLGPVGGIVDNALGSSQGITSHALNMAQGMTNAALSPFKGVFPFIGPLNGAAQGVVNSVLPAVNGGITQGLNMAGGPFRG